MPKKKQYISLREAMEYCDYSQEYLSLRARQGKLKAIKIGRNWATKKEWVLDYLDNFNGNSKHKNNAKKNVSFKTNKELNLKPLEFNSFFSVDSNPESERKFSIPLASHHPISVSSYLKKKPKRKISKKLVFAFKTLAVFCLVMVSAVSFVYKNDIQYPFEEIELLFKDANYIIAQIGSGEIKSFAAENLKDYLSWLSLSIKNLPQNFKENYIAANEVFKEKVSGFFNIVISPFQKIYFHFASFKEEETEDELKILEKKEEEGMVIVPSTDKNENLKEKIQKSFSDDLKIDPKDETSGIITPIFKERKGEDYFYIMVPMTN